MTAGLAECGCETGRELRAGVVVSNADPKHTLLVLVHPDDLPADYVLAIDARSTDVSYLKYSQRDGSPPGYLSVLGPASNPSGGEQYSYRSIAGELS